MVAKPEIEELEDHDRGLAFDLPNLLHRRQALKFLGGAAVAAVAAACGSSDSSDGASPASSTTTTTTETSSSSDTTGATEPTSPIPEETAGPFPGDGSNGPNALADSGVVRSDIRSSFGSMSGTAEGIPVTVNLRVLDSATGGAMSGAAVYLWHCDRDGGYSMYSDGVADQNYLRGVQEAGSDGTLSFTSIFPAAYSGRWPHMHFEVYSTLGDASGSGTPITTSQLALPEDSCNTAYATSGYEQSVTNLQRTSLQDDMIFADGVTQQMATVDGTVDDGFTISLNVPV